MTKKLVEIAAEIVQNQVSSNPMSSEEIVNSLKTVFSALQAMQKSEMEGCGLEAAKAGKESEGAERAAGKVDPRNSILEDRIVCLECGAEMRQLTAKHLGAHGLTPRDYKTKYGFPMKQPLSARELTRNRSRAAKKRGLPENLVKYQEAKKQQRLKEMASGLDSAAAAPPVVEPGTETTRRKPRRKKTE